MKLIIVKDPAIAHISKMKFEMIVEHELNHLMVNRVKLQHTIPPNALKGSQTKASL